jgi:hypothetical protein
VCLSFDKHVKECFLLLLYNIFEHVRPTKISTMPQPWIQYNTDNKVVGKAHFKNIKKGIASNMGTHVAFPCIFERNKFPKMDIFQCKFNKVIEHGLLTPSIIAQDNQRNEPTTCIK